MPARDAKPTLLAPAYDHSPATTHPLSPHSMADFRTHVTTSSVLGVGYAGMGMVMGIPIETSLVGGGLCGVSGMLPDLDSDSGIPIRESTAFAAGIVPMLLVDRFLAIGMPYDRMVLVTAALYFLIRFAGASMLGRFTVHRGMFHSIPAALIFAGIAFLICGPAYAQENIRYFKAGAVLFGVMSHLLLDELYSIQWKGGMWKLKRSSGTALKLWGKNGWANVSTYAKLAVVGMLIASEPTVMQRLEARNPRLAEGLQQFKDYKTNLRDTIQQRVASEPPAQQEPDRSSNSLSPNQMPDWRMAPWQTDPHTDARPAPGFRPNSGAQVPGTAERDRRAEGNFPPR